MSAIVTFVFGALVGCMAFIGFFAALAFMRIATRDQPFEQHLRRYYSSADIGRIRSEAAYQR